MLGPLEAWHGGAPVPLGDQQQRFILVVLLLHVNRPISPERLTEVVWPDQPERRSLVRGYINKLRIAFRDADAAIETTPTGYVLRVDEDQLDVARFDRLREESLRTSDKRRQIELLREAVDLRRGPFLEDIDIDRVGGAEVVSPEAAYSDAVGDLAELELAVGDHRSARDRLRRAVRQDPARQKYAELLMRALLAGGDNVEAVRIFRETSDALAEYNMEPGTALRNLAARAERGEPASSLPSRPGMFTGRVKELDVITGLDGRAVWVSGAPGSGKTGLAIEAAYRLRDRFPDGQFLVRLNGFTPNVVPMAGSEALTRLLLELGVPPEQIPTTESRKAALYQTKLYGTRTLVVLDNAFSPEQVRALLPAAEGCLAIVTSRRMGDPDTGEPVRLSPLPADDAAALFRVLTGPHRVRGKSAEVAEVVRRCGCLPVQIQVAAALFRRHDQWSLEHLLGQLDDLSGPAALQASYQQLDLVQQNTFRLFGHVPGADLHVTGAAALVDSDVAWARAVLDTLHEVCLLEEIAPDRYQMLDPLKEFAAALPQHTSDALLRLLDFYLVTLAGAAAVGYPFDQLPTVDLRAPAAPTFDDPDAAVAWIAAERANLVAAIRYAATNGEPEHAWRLAVLMWRYFNTTNRLEDWVDTLEQAREIVRDNDHGQAHVLLRLATAHDRLGRLTEARALAEQALPKWTRLGDARGEAATLCAIAIPAMELGEHEFAITQFEAALEKYEQCDDVRGQAHALGMLGYLNGIRGRPQVALRHHLAAAPMLREINHPGLAHALNNLGAVQLDLGLLAEAMASHTEAYEHADEVDDRCAAAYALNNIGNVYRAQGQLAEAEHFQTRAKVTAAEVNDVDLRTQLYHDRGATALAGRKLADALRMFEAALDLAIGTGNRLYQAHAHHGVAQTLHALGKHADAGAHWDVAEAQFTELDQPEAEAVRAERAGLECDRR
ncbi:AfsR/SARP family transcriptional regulator [Kutzneria sp. CA-103260]|uniref:AfsR/SARP family transcriptional regulator n=1 Tax=Kutzneria sp. CA-103260 TaxID=2802641 RepID=UPI001BA4E718|nr:tetratricopeptide repeat protein [Kutzneria sp. CA-103260]